MDLLAYKTGDMPDSVKETFQYEISDDVTVAPTQFDDIWLGIQAPDADRSPHALSDKHTVWAWLPLAAKANPDCQKDPSSEE